MTARPHETALVAPAKVNLFLHVGERRADGYHDICSLAAFADFGDRLTGEVADDLSLSISGPFASGLPTGAENLVVRAGRALQEWARGNGRQVAGAALQLEKRLPQASGIGGGSSDAAAALKLLARLWDLPATAADLARVGFTLGADVPVCLLGRAAVMEGVGEKLSLWPAFPPLPAVLVNPGAAVMTADVFRALDKRSGVTAPVAAEFKSPREVAVWLRLRANDLEGPARTLVPVIGDVLAEISATTGCLLSRMSGSGATCFGLYESPQAACAAASVLASRRKNWWVTPATLR